MVLYKNKHFITRSDAPDTDFIGDADYVVPDDSEIAEKIKTLYPNFDFVLGDDGNIMGITATEPVITSEQVETRKIERIQESKTRLVQWLSNNPLFYDGNYYSCTEEKQSLLNSNLASYERAVAAGIEYPLKWNATGCECVTWEYNELRKLSLYIAAYVAPKVSMQQSLEIKIKSCTTLDEINLVEICYDD